MCSRSMLQTLAYDSWVTSPASYWSLLCTVVSRVNIIHMVLHTHLRSSQVVLVELHPYHLEISFFYKNLKKNKAGTVFIGSLQVYQDVYMCVCNL